MTEKNRATRLITSLMGLGLMFGILLASETASASVVTDIPDDLANALGISSNLAGMILSMGILMGLTLVLAIARMPPVGIVIPLLAVMILLTVMKWLDESVLIFSAIITCIYFGLVIKDTWGK